MDGLYRCTNEFKKKSFSKGSFEEQSNHGFGFGFASFNQILNKQKDYIHFQT